MYLHVNTFLFSYVSTVMAQEVIEPEYRVARVTHKIRAFASLDAPRVGIVYKDDVFESGPIVGYTDCAAGWAKVGPGVICLVKTEVVADKAIVLPTFMDVLPPDTQGQTELRVATEQDPSFMPVLFATRDDEHQGRLWASIEELEAGEGHRWKLKQGKDYRFVAAHQSQKGWVLERPNGSVTLMSDVYVYPVSRFSGRDFREFPKKADGAMAWIKNPNGAMVYWSANEEQASGILLERRRILEVENLEDNTEWLKVPMGDVDGFVQRSTLTIWEPVDKPGGVEEDEVWIDADVSSQMFSVFEGDTLLFTTLMSTAKEGHTTPLGTYQIYDKAVGWDLGSKEGAKNPYYMEDVPFVMHYYPRYAIHSAFWHDNFGEPASHGCINLSPKDAWTVYQLVSPEMPDGWQYVKQNKEDPGTVIRIRDGQTVGKRKRIAPKY
jgi:hypothetical protein